MSEPKETGHSPKFKSKIESAQIISSIWNVFRRNMPRRDIGKTAIAVLASSILMSYSHLHLSVAQVVVTMQVPALWC